jgi:hypothetical protein
MQSLRVPLAQLWVPAGSMNGMTCPFGMASALSCVR